MLHCFWFLEGLRQLELIHVTALLVTVAGWPSDLGRGWKGQCPPRTCLTASCSLAEEPRLASSKATSNTYLICPFHKCWWSTCLGCSPGATAVTLGNWGLATPARLQSLEHCGEAQLTQHECSLMLWTCTQILTLRLV